MYKKQQYVFYLEKRDENTGIGPFLKYGKKGKNVTAMIDLSLKPVEQTEGANNIIVIRVPDSRR
jgi:hypothetical protein